MISANRARKKTEAVRNARNNNGKYEMKNIEREIEDAINRGENKISFVGTISQQTTERLRKLGYEVHTGSQYNESYFTIKW